MAVVVLAPWAIVYACGGSDPAQIDVPDDSGGDVSNDSAARKDARPSGDDGSITPPPATYNDFSDASLWSFTDFDALLGQGPDSGIPAGFLGAIFDGKYMYFTPTGNHTTVGVNSNATSMLRYDTTTAFDSAASYSAANLSAIGPSLAYIGGAFDGRYLYPAPYQGNPFARVDTKAAGFSDLDASWSFGETSAIAHFGAISAGNYVYYAPISTLMQRLDRSDGGIGEFDVAALDAGALAYQGVVFDGRYAYYLPAPTTPSGNVSRVLRFDTQADFATGASWTSFDTTQVDPNAHNFTGGVFDGRYLYLTPTAFDPATPSAVRFVRYDTKADFASAGSWEAFATTPDAASIAYHTAGFDGRYVYFLPFVESGSYFLVRFDSTKTFTDPTAWTTVDTTKFNAGATGFEGVGFDGRYLYFVPRYGHIAARFDAKTPASLPPGFSGSFL